MYERDYGTDWDSLDQDAAHERAYALGVATALGETYEGELDRILEELTTAYEQSFIRLAYKEGKAKAAKYQKRTDRSTEDETIWEDLVTEVTVGEPEPYQATGGVPGAVTRIEMLAPPSDNLDSIRLPEFLTR